MNPILRDIFKAIHEGRWLSVEYRNRQGETTRYWIGIRNLNVRRRSLSADGLHLGLYTLERLDCIYIDSILSSQVIEGSYCPVNESLVRDIRVNSHKYKTLFQQAANLRVLNYLEDCSRMDTTPYKKDFALVRYLDRDSFRGEVYPLSDEQFRTIVREFQKKARPPRRMASDGKKTGDPEGAERRPEAAGNQNGSEMAEPGRRGRISLQRLAMNVLSIHTEKGLYVLACRLLNLDVRGRCLRPADEITVCTEFTVDGVKESIRRYLDGRDYELLRDFEKNQEQIRDAVARGRGRRAEVDDMPYIIGLGIDLALDLHKEYGGILDMYQNGQASVPVRAFFGDLLDRPRSRRAVPLTLLDRQVNLDQLLAVDHAMKYPVSYVQGPPGTGKTTTIINTIITAFYNEKTVLFTAYNNHPIDSVMEKLTAMTYGSERIPFPVIRLGNSEKVLESLASVRRLYERYRTMQVFDKTLSRNRNRQTQARKQLSELLRRYEEQLEMKEREETITRLLEYEQKNSHSMGMLPFEADLRGRQLAQVSRRIRKLGEVTDEEALGLLADDGENLRHYLFYTSVRYIKKIDSPGHERFREILYMDEPEQQLAQFHKYLSDGENLKAFLEIFPVVATTCISAHRLGDPAVHFDLTVMDEASQCDTATGLVPVLRGASLMLVGDPQQLNPVILLDESANQRLRKKYSIREEYDYRKNSIYKAFLACDAVSDEVLLRNHYRCSPEIIGFNNRKYYHSRLQIQSEPGPGPALVYIDVKDGSTREKNTAPAEAAEVLDYARAHPDQSIGIITPFVNQKNLIQQRLREAGLSHVTCGTVHAFQGDEKDVVLFSTALTDDTWEGTYEWLKNNRELINVATSRARQQLVVLASGRNLERLHRQESEDDLYELVQYVRSGGACQVTAKRSDSRALGVKPFSTATEEAFLENLNHALENLWLSQNRFTVEREVAVSQVFQENITWSDLFYSGRFDFVVYEADGIGKYPVLVIELDGKEHFDSETVKARDQKKQEICRAHHMQLIRVENSYARRYQHMKMILENYFKIRH